MYALADHLDQSARPRLSPRGRGTVILLHVLLLFGLVRLNVITLPAPLAVLTISLLPPSPEIRPPPEIVPPQPKPVARRPLPLPPPTQIAAPADSPAPTPVTVAPAPTLEADAPSSRKHENQSFDVTTQVLPAVKFPRSEAEEVGLGKSG